MAFNEFKVITAARKIIIQRRITNAVREQAFTAADIRANLGENIPESEFNMWVEELLHKGYLYKKNSGDLTITEVGIAYGIALEDFPVFVEHFLAHNVDFTLRIYALDVKQSPPTLSQIVDTDRSLLAGELASKKQDLLRRFFDAQIWSVHLEYANAHDVFPVSDFGVSTGGDCWLRVQDGDYILRRIR